MSVELEQDLAVTIAVPHDEHPVNFTVTHTAPEPTLVLYHALRKLRHLYEQMLDGRVRPTVADMTSAANGLLNPAIRDIETYLK